jgi:hypothetical protein
MATLWPASAESDHGILSCNRTDGAPAGLRQEQTGKNVLIECLYRIPQRSSIPGKAIEGLRPSFSAQVRFGEPGAPVALLRPWFGIGGLI